MLDPCPNLVELFSSRLVKLHFRRCAGKMLYVLSGQFLLCHPAAGEASFLNICSQLFLEHMSRNILFFVSAPNTGDHPTADETFHMATIFPLVPGHVMTSLIESVSASAVTLTVNWLHCLACLT